MLSPLLAGECKAQSAIPRLGRIFRFNESEFLFRVGDEFRQSGILRVLGRHGVVGAMTLSLRPQLGDGQLLQLLYSLGDNTFNIFVDGFVSTDVNNIGA